MGEIGTSMGFGHIKSFHAKYTYTTLEEQDYCIYLGNSPRLTRQTNTANVLFITKKNNYILMASSTCQVLVI